MRRNMQPFWEQVQEWHRCTFGGVDCVDGHVGPSHRAAGEPGFRHVQHGKAWLRRASGASVNEMWTLMILAPRWEELVSSWNSSTAQDALVFELIWPHYWLTRVRETICSTRQGQDYLSRDYSPSSTNIFPSPLNWRQLKFFWILGL